MSAQNGTQTRPLSPWAEKYGASWCGDLGDGQRHSLLNPIFPRLDPVFYDDLPLGDLGELNTDQVLCSQRMQLDDLGGIFSYQLGSLNEYLGLSGIHGGHSAKYNRNQNRQRHENRLLVVNEDDWFDFFQKGRWWEPVDNPLIDERIANPIRCWNPQSDRIWKELRIILEFCNRTLVKLIEERDPWLDALLFGDLVYSDASPVPRKSSPSPASDDPIWCIKYRSAAELPRQQEYRAQARDQLLRLTKTLLFGFRGWFRPASPELTEYLVDGTVPWADTGLATEPEPPKRSCVMIWLNVIHLRVLVERDPTPAQASTVRLSQASTILHELAHAIYEARYREFKIDPNGEEPFMGEEQIRELGHSFVNHIFGGTLQGIPFPKVPLGQLSGQQITLTDRSLDQKSLFSQYDQFPRDGWDAVLYGIGRSPRWLIPPVVSSFLFDQEFWDNVVSTKGTKALQPGRLRAWGGSVVDVGPQVDVFRDPLKRVQNKIETRKKTVGSRHLSKNIRRFQDQEKWKKSLWSHTSLRKDITAFYKYHSRRRYGPCRRIAADLEQRAVLGQKMLRPKTSDRSLRTAYAVVSGIAYLTMASLPAMRLGSVNDLRESRLQIWQDPTDVEPKSRVGDRFGQKADSKDYVVTSIDGSNPQKLTHPSQYLEVMGAELIDKGLSHTHENVHRPWATACIQSYHELLKLRQIGGAASERRHWARFDFRVPPCRLDNGLADCPPPYWEPKSKGPDPQPPRAERFLLPTEIHEKELLLIKTANAQGWSCYPVDKSKHAEVQKYWVKTPYGRALQDNNGDEAVWKLRAELRKSRPSGILIPW
ncbi:cytochrome b5-like Heme/Steroid binding domain-containing protein [Apiospora saccharicola]